MVPIDPPVVRACKMIAEGNPLPDKNKKGGKKETRAR